MTARPAARPTAGARRRGVLATAVAAVLLGGCSPGPAPAPAPRPSPSPAPAGPSSPAGPSAPAGPSSPSAPSPGPDAADPEPTTTTTLPPPPAPTGPAPSEAGDLRADALPVPAGWATVALEGGAEEGFEGNGTWVHARDPRYAAQDAITIGCADVTRDDYPDPVAALEGNYVAPDGAPGVGLALDFADEAAASTYWQRYTAQVEACQDLGEPVTTVLVPDLPGLVDRRTYPDGEWTEIGRQRGARVTLVILGDEGHRLSRAAARAILEQLG